MERKPLRMKLEEYLDMGCTLNGDAMPVPEPENPND